MRMKKIFTTLLIFGLVSTSGVAFAANKNVTQMGDKQIVNMCRDGWNYASYYRPFDTNGDPRAYSTLTFANNNEFLSWASTNESFPPLNNFTGDISLAQASEFIKYAAAQYYPDVTNLNEAIHYVCADLNGDWLVFTS